VHAHGPVLRDRPAGPCEEEPIWSQMSGIRPGDTGPTSLRGDADTALGTIPRTTSISAERRGISLRPFTRRAIAHDGAHSRAPPPAQAGDHRAGLAGLREHRAGSVTTVGRSASSCRRSCSGREEYRAGRGPTHYGMARHHLFQGADLPRLRQGALRGSVQLPLFDEDEW